jgi:PTH1 family peptidyl-tRNA hydrolase
MKLIVGLGNPGSEYEQTPHNVGFWLIDALAEHWQCAVHQEKFRAITGKAGSGDEATMLMKPLTYMNRSGEAVAECARFFKIPPSDIIVCSDDLDLAQGKGRLRTGGGHGGHNGLRSIMQHLSSDQFRRIRLGIGRPPDNVPAADYVLRRWPQAATELCQRLIQEVIPHLDHFARTSTFPHTSLNAPHQ